MLIFSIDSEWKIVVRSVLSFADGNLIPSNTGDGDDVSPPLEWSQARGHQRACTDLR
jgi:hypothetical protein